MPDPEYKFLVFGSTGAIGGAIVDAALARRWKVVGASRRPSPPRDGMTSISVDPFADGFSPEALRSHAPYSAVCWAQGSNLNDSAYNVDLERHLEMYKANCLYILATLKALLNADLLARPARLCIISSIWQNRARQEKLSYTITKAALQGLVLSASTDLAADGHLLNAVLPGALDTPMTHQNLKPEQIRTLSAATRFNRLPSMQDVTSLVMFLCSPENPGITGQFIAADLGFSNVHLL